MSMDRSEAQRDWFAEDVAGAQRLPPVAPEEDAALSLELARENAEGTEDAGLCDWCERPFSGSIFSPYCSSECEDEAEAETYHSIHPRPEEVG